MRGTFILPLYPLDEAVLLPGEKLGIGAPDQAARAILERARGFGGTLVASLIDGSSVHEVGVTALVSGEGSASVSLHGVSRCRLLSLVDEDVALVRAERFPEAAAGEGRDSSLARLLLGRYERFCQRMGKALRAPASRSDLSAITWSITADLGLSAEQQQGFLNVPDPRTRGKLLLVAVRELEGRERFLRPWAHLRSSKPWN